MYFICFGGGMVDTVDSKSALLSRVRVRVPFEIHKNWSYNSVGSECNPYKIEVVGSNPTETTNNTK